MTPRIKPSISDPNLEWFTEALLSQQNSKTLEYDLSGAGPIFKLAHPALIRAEHSYKFAPQELKLRSASSGWNLESFQDLLAAQTRYHAPVYGGFPWQINKFLSDNPGSAILDFAHLGSLYVSRSSLDESTPTELHFYHHALPIWLDYALSPELWGPTGKWIRFHTSLHTLFEKYGLLTDQDFPGFYPLKSSAQYLWGKGFKGSIVETNFNLTFPWDFPLSGLKVLEETIRREP